MNGYTGKILRVDLSSRKISMIETQAYEGWVGGHGLGSAIFWDLVKDKNLSGFDPRNVVTIMTSPLTGTQVPGGASRTEMQGIGVQSYPIGWFTRSNLGGRFGAMLKYAGWDGIVLEGKADQPVWIDVRDDEVQVRDARGLWGLDTWETQKRLWQEVTGRSSSGWLEPEAPANDRRTTQRPAVLCIGPAGEKLGRIAAVIHDAGNAAGQGGFGGVWGAKNLKAISVIGTGGIQVHDPQSLLEARAWVKQNYRVNVADPAQIEQALTPKRIFLASGRPAVPVVFWQRDKRSRPQACVGCPAGCRARNSSGLGNESHCMDTIFYSGFDLHRNSGLLAHAAGSALESAGQQVFSVAVLMKYGRQTAAYSVTDLAQKYGINAFELGQGLIYLSELHKMGALGRGKAIATDLDFSQLGSLEFGEKLLHQIAFREGLGDDLAEGFVRAAKKWGRLDQDLETGLLRYPHWGIPDHYDPRFQTEWGYGSILGDRDINEHCFNTLYWMPSVAKWARQEPFVSAEEAAQIYCEKMAPYAGDPLMLDYSEDNVYSERMVKLVAWHRRYTRFWKQSTLFCDYLFPDFINPTRPDKRGMTGEAEPKFLKAVTGKDLSFTEGLELGRKIWNLDNAVWTLQGRHRDMVHFAEYIYKQPYPGLGSWTLCYMPGRKNGVWDYYPMEGRRVDKKKFDEWKTGYYRFEGWDPRTGWPRKTTLAGLGLHQVAGELERNGKLGGE